MKVVICTYTYAALKREGPIQSQLEVTTLTFREKLLELADEAKKAGIEPRGYDGWFGLMMDRML